MSLLVSPTHFKAAGHDNPHIVSGPTPKAEKEHAALCKVVRQPVILLEAPLQDAVFVADAGVKLPGLPVVLLSRMKYKHRRMEQPYHVRLFHDLGFATLPFPRGVFEGQSEVIFFKGATLAVHGYGFRSTRATGATLQRILNSVYETPPAVVCVELVDPYLFHLDIAMLKVDETTCVIHKRAFSPKTVDALRKLLTVHVIDVDDLFCLNAIVNPPRLLTRKVSAETKRLLERLTHLTVTPTDVSSFERAGGSVRCLVFDL